MNYWHMLWYGWHKITLISERSQPQKPHIWLHLEMSRKEKYIETENRWMIPYAWGRGWEQLEINI